MQLNSSFYLEGVKFTGQILLPFGCLEIGLELIYYRCHAVFR